MMDYTPAIAEEPMRGGPERVTALLINNTVF